LIALKIYVLSYLFHLLRMMTSLIISYCNECYSQIRFNIISI